MSRKIANRLIVIVSFWLGALTSTVAYMHHWPTWAFTTICGVVGFISSMIGGELEWRTRND